MPDRHKGKVLLYDSRKCTNCRLCELVCSFKHYGTFDFDKSNIRNVFSPGRNGTEVAHCLHCDNALCMEACPSGAIYRSENGHVLINSMKCIGCKTCISACPVGVIWFDEREGSARKCDFCDGKTTCASYCPTGALTEVDRDKYRRQMEYIYEGD